MASLLGVQRCIGKVANGITVEIAGEEVSGYPQIDTNDLFSGGDGEQHGVGDDENSWGVDGDRQDME